MKPLPIILAALVSAALLLISHAATVAPLPTTAASAAMSGPAPAPSILRTLDLDGHIQRIGDHTVTAVVFLGTECPIARQAIPTLNRIAGSIDMRTQMMIGVLSEPDLSRADAQKFAREHALQFPVVLDATGSIAAQFQPKRTPEAFVLSKDGSVVYRGRIDDSFYALTKKKQSPTSNDLADAIAAVIDGKSIDNPLTEVVGCEFEATSLLTQTPETATWSRDVAPILFANCATCHRPGEAAPFSLLSYEDAAKHAKMIASVTEDRVMPPWKPAPGYGHLDGERRLTDRDIAVLRKWSENGAPAGEIAEAPEAPVFLTGWSLGTPDLVVKMSEPFTVPAGGRDIYRAFVIPLNLPENTFVSAVEFRPGNASVAHHALFYLDDQGRAREKDAADPGPGYTSFGGPGFLPSGGLGGWAPGAKPAYLPVGVGRKVAANSDLVLQMHYHPTGKEETDQSQVALYLAKTPTTRPVQTFMLANRRIDIPPGEANYIRTADVTTPADITIYGVFPHMHLVGREMKVWATLPDGSEVPIIRVDDWDFKWQGEYRLSEPLTLPKGTTVHLWARYDNSEHNPNNPSNPPKRVRNGEQTTDEMCMAFLTITARGGKGEMRRAQLKSLLGN